MGLIGGVWNGDGQAFNEFMVPNYGWLGGHLTAVSCGCVVWTDLVG